jgi:hypothetical protein
MRSSINPTIEFANRVLELRVKRWAVAEFGIAAMTYGQL